MCSFLIIVFFLFLSFGCVECWVVSWCGCVLCYGWFGVFVVVFCLVV